MEYRSRVYLEYRSRVYLEYRSKYGGKRIPGPILNQQKQNGLRNRNRDSILIFILIQEQGLHPCIYIISGTGTPSLYVYNFRNRDSILVYI